MISKDLAVKFIERVTRYTDYNVNIMDANGIIIASRDHKRVGQYHEIAYRLITGMENSLATTGTAYPNVLPGINMVIKVDDIRKGVVGVTGEPAEIRPVALIIKMAIETMLKYERQQELARVRANKKEHFIYLLMQVENSDPEELRGMADDLGYPEEMVRIPILVKTETVDSDRVLQFLRDSPLHTKKDFSFALSFSHALVFKTLPGKTKELFSDYKLHLQEYLSPFLDWVDRNGHSANFYVGSFQDTYPQYYYAYHHCRWLEQCFPEERREPIFFYDHAGDYLREAIPMGELQRIFHVYRSHIPADRLRIIAETTGVLIQANYNFGRAAELLYVHKNTLVYRYNNLKSYLNIDPLSFAGDKAFLEAFYSYLCRCGEL